MALAVTSDDVSRGELLLTLGEAQARAGDTPASKTTFRRAAELAASQRDAEQLARAAIGYGGRLIWDVSRDDEYLVPLLERALGALGEEDNALRVRVMARLAGGPLRERSGTTRPRSGSAVAPPSVYALGSWACRRPSSKPYIGRVAPRVVSTRPTGVRSQPARTCAAVSVSLPFTEW